MRDVVAGTSPGIIAEQAGHHVAIDFRTSVPARGYSINDAYVQSKRFIRGRFNSLKESGKERLLDLGPPPLQFSCSLASKLYSCAIHRAIHRGSRIERTKS